MTLIELRKLANEWIERECDEDDIRFDGGSTSINKLMRAYIAAANPAAVISLLDQIQTLQAENEKLKEAAFVQRGELLLALGERDAYQQAADKMAAEHKAERDALAAKLVTLTGEHIKAAHICHQAGRVSVSMVQRKLATGYNRAQQLVTEIVAARLVDGLEVAGLPNSAHGIQAKGGQHEDA